MPMSISPASSFGAFSDVPLVDTARISRTGSTARIASMKPIAYTMKLPPSAAVPNFRIFSAARAREPSATIGTAASNVRRLIVCM